jgi:hypothetical protein
LQHGASSTQHEPVGQHERPEALSVLVMAKPAHAKLLTANAAANTFPIMNQSPRGFRALISAITATAENDTRALPNRNEDSLAAQAVMQIKQVGGVPKRPVAGHTGLVFGKLSVCRGGKSEVVGGRRKLRKPIGNCRIRRFRRWRQETAACRRLTARAFLVGLRKMTLIRFVFRAPPRFRAARRQGRLKLCGFRWTGRSAVKGATAQGRAARNRQRQIADDRNS